ncbi:MAG: hypothetical protein JW881_20610 [Spirochaetales bacterium]|nr:hypothetical protein [Spirochaetales bacterium]
MKRLSNSLAGSAIGCSAILFALIIISFIILPGGCNSIQRIKADTEPEKNTVPVLLDESFESGKIPTTIQSWQSDSDYKPQAIDDNGNMVLKLISSSDIFIPEENHPHYSGFSFHGGPNERPLRTDWEYELDYRLKLVEYAEGWTALTFRYYGNSFDDRSTFGISPGLKAHIESQTQGEDIDLNVILTADQWYRVKVILRKHNYSVYVDDTLVFYEDGSPTETTNAVCEVAGGMTVYIDDVSWSGRIFKRRPG